MDDGTAREVNNFYNMAMVLTYAHIAQAGRGWDINQNHYDHD